MDITAVITYVTHLGLVSWLLLLILFFVSYNYLSKSPWIKLPPGPACLPILGSIPFFPSKNLYTAMNLWRDKYGDVFTVYMGGDRVIVVNGYSAIKELLVKQGHAFVDRPQDTMTKLSNNKGIAFVSGDTWKEQRRFVLHVLKDLGLGKSVMEDKIHEEMEYFLMELTAAIGQPFDPAALIQKTVTNVITSLAFGKRMDYDDPNFRSHLASLKSILDRITPGCVTMVFPIIQYLPGDYFGWKKATTELENLRNIYRTWIEEHKSRDPDEEATNLIGAYVKVIRKEANNPDTTYTEDQLVHVISDLYGAGSDTTTSTLKWLIAFMTLNPDIQAKVQEEIDDVIGESRVPRMADRALMPYTEACLHETQRLGEIGGLNLPHAPLEDVVFQGFTIPKGTSVIANFHSVHADRSLFPEPEKFNPCHFLDSEGKVMRREELTPFAMGKRVCIGEGLARMELFLCFTTMLQRFTFKPAEGADGPSYEGVFTFTHQPKPYKILISNRK